MALSSDELRIAILIPCYNEAVTIGRVVRDFGAALPDALIYVYDNNSSDETVVRAREAGAIVRKVRRQGKGYVVCRMFADVEADAYVLVDGDGTYDASDSTDMVEALVAQQLDMVTGTRIEAVKESYRRGHRFGNWMLTRLVRMIFGNGVSDMLSGYRVFSRRFVKSFPALSTGFEIETQFTIHALELDVPMSEVMTQYRERPQGSASKLRTYRDGWRILRTIVALVKDERPLPFFMVCAAVILIAALALGLPVVVEFMRTGRVPRLPTAVLAAALVGVACLGAVCGLVMDSVQRGRKEAKRLAYLAVVAPRPARLRLRSGA
jgi:glycosyltransferase involved in cell wall biosynthesis